MREEIEVKLRLEDPAALLRELERAGAQLLRSTQEEDTYYSHPCRDFGSTDEALRIRVSPQGAELTYKGPRGGGEVKSRAEITVKVEDPASAAELLRSLGFEPVATIRKRRSYYRLGRAIVSVDDVEGLGHFLEIEAEDESLGAQYVESVARSLGLRWSPVEETYLEMALRRLRDSRA